MDLVQIPAGKVVFIIEDNFERIRWFEESFHGSCDLVVKTNPDSALAYFQDRDVSKTDVFFFDHDLGGAPYLPPFSTDVAKRLIEHDPEVGNRVIIHSLNESGARNLQALMPGSVWLRFGTFDIEVI
jgi:hypothetical protein